MDSFANARPLFVLACLPHADSEPEPTFRVISTCDEFSASLPYLIDMMCVSFLRIPVCTISHNSSSYSSTCMQ